MKLRLLADGEMFKYKNAVYVVNGMEQNDVRCEPIRKWRNYGGMLYLSEDTEVTKVKEQTVLIELG